MFRFGLTILLLLFNFNSHAENHPTLYTLGNKNTIDPKDQRIPFTRLLSHEIFLTKQHQEILQQSEFNIPMPEGFIVTVETLKYEKKNDIHIFLGRVKKDPQSLVSLQLNQNRLTGTMSAGGKFYQIQSDKTSNLRIDQIKLNRSLYKVDDVSHEDERLSPRAIVTTPSTDNFVDLIIGYTTEAAANADIETVITGWVAAANQMLADSCVNFRFRLLSMINTGVATGADDASTVIANLGNPAGPFSMLHTARDAQGADLVHLIVDSGTIGLCGLANLGGTGGVFDDTRGFGLTLYGCPDFVLAHELGHNLSLRHDRYQQDLGLTESAVGGEHYGFVDTANQYESIMSYQDQCIENGTFCNRMNKFSNPRISHNGVAFGIDQFADNADGLNRSYPFIAAYRPSQGTFNPDINEFCASSDANKDLNCFIATATYGSSLHPKIDVLRSFRDRVLKNSILGKIFIKLYYTFSPHWALKIQNNPQLKKFSRDLIGGLVFILENIFWVFLIFSLLVLFRNRIRNFAAIFILVVFVPKPSTASVTYTPFDISEITTNPSASLSDSQKTFAGLQAETFLGTAEPAPLSSVDASGTSFDLFFGYQSATFSGNLRYRPEFDVENKITNQPLAEITNTEASDLIIGDIAFPGFFGNPMGLRVTAQNIKTSTDGTDLTDSSLLAVNYGSSSRISNFLFGGGLTYNSQSLTDLSNSNQKVSTSWLSVYAGIGIDFGGQIELTYERNPEVVQIENGSQIVRPETSDIHIRFQYLYALGLGSFLIGVDHQILRAQEVETLLPDPPGQDQSTLLLGYQTSSWALNSSLYMRNQTAGFERQDFGLKVAFSLIFGSSGGFSDTNSRFGQPYQ